LGGDGELEQARHYANKLDVAHRVECLGWVTGEHKRALLARCTVFVLPSYNEGQPMSVLEAMAAGTPVLSTRTGGVPDAVTDGVNGLLVEAGDVEALSAALSVLLSNEALRRRLGQCARDRVRDAFSTDVLLPQLEEIYDEVRAVDSRYRSGNPQRSQS
jgi:glycosyltransferase involved in cell wall biosynthesis